jgi:hypothetical protein
MTKMIKGGRKSSKNEIDAFAQNKQEENKRLSNLIREQRKKREQRELQEQEQEQEREQEETVSCGLFGCRGGKKTIKRKKSKKSKTSKKYFFTY